LRYRKSRGLDEACTARRLRDLFGSGVASLMETPIDQLLTELINELWMPTPSSDIGA
jgi:hypothetical protein